MWRWKGYFDRTTICFICGGIALGLVGPTLVTQGFAWLTQARTEAIAALVLGLFGGFIAISGRHWE